MVTKSKKSAVKKSAREGTISSVAVPLILAGKLTIAEIVAAVKKQFPKSAFSASHVYWHRQNQKSLGAKVPEVVVGERAAPKKKSAVKKTAKKSAKKSSKKKAARAAKIPSTPKAAAESAGVQAAL